MGCRSESMDGLAPGASSPAEFERATQTDFHLLIGTSHFPRVRRAKPVVRHFLLPSVLNGLPEYAVLISQAVAHGRELHRGGRFHEAGCQPPKPAVSQARIGFLLQYLERVQFLVFENLLARADSSRRFVTLFSSERPMRNSIER